MYKSVLLLDVETYLDSQPKRHREKVEDMMRLLESYDGVLDEPYTRNLKSKIRELRVNFGGLNHRILFTLLPDQIILHLLAFTKKTQKTPPRIIERAIILRDAYIELIDKK